MVHSPILRLLGSWQVHWHLSRLNQRTVNTLVPGQCGRTSRLSHLKHAARLWLGFLLLAGSSVAQAQVRPQSQKKISSPQLLTAREGEEIVQAAWERDQQPDRAPDCSHLAHEVYSRAGYPYPYARSVDLYV